MVLKHCSFCFSFPSLFEQAQIAHHRQQRETTVQEFMRVFLFPPPPFSRKAGDEK